MLFTAAHLVHVRPPPGEVVRAARVKHREEDEDASDGDRAVERRAEDKVVPLPPVVLAPADPEAEDQADDGPAAVVRARRGGDVVEAAEEEGDVDLAEPAGLREDVLPQEPDGDGQQGAEEEEPEEGVVEGARGEEAAGPDGAPDHGGVEVGAGEGAGEAVGGLFGADVGDVVERPVDHGDLGQCADEDADGLDQEELPRGDL